MKQFIIHEDLAQAAINYLSTRPYREVAQLMVGLMQIPEHVAAKEGAADVETRKSAEG